MQPTAWLVEVSLINNSNRNKFSCIFCQHTVRKHVFLAWWCLCFEIYQMPNNWAILCGSQLYSSVEFCFSLRLPPVIWMHTVGQQMIWRQCLLKTFIQFLTVYWDYWQMSHCLTGWSQSDQQYPGSHNYNYSMLLSASKQKV